MDEGLTVYILCDQGVVQIPLPDVTDVELAGKIVRTVIALQGVLVWDDGTDAIMG